jgi:hypothetical protein
MKKQTLKNYIIELQQLSIDAGHESSSYWFLNYLSFGEQRSVYNWCMRNRKKDTTAAQAIQQIRGLFS